MSGISRPNSSFKLDEAVKAKAKAKAIADGLDLTAVVNALLGMYGEGVIVLDAYRRNTLSLDTKAATR